MIALSTLTQFQCSLKGLGICYVVTCCSSQKWVSVTLIKSKTLSFDLKKYSTKPDANTTNLHKTGKRASWVKLPNIKLTVLFLEENLLFIQGVKSPQLLIDDYYKKLKQSPCLK